MRETASCFRAADNIRACELELLSKWHHVDLIRVGRVKDSYIQKKSVKFPVIHCIFYHPLKFSLNLHVRPLYSGSFCFII
jgi:hypothetical protein